MSRLAPSIVAIRQRGVFHAKMDPLVDDSTGPNIIREPQYPRPIRFIKVGL